jgi:hypothetical protein
MVMMEEELNSIVYSKDVIEFVTVANEYCNFLENANHYKTSRALSVAQKILPLVYLKATLLPEVDKVFEEDIEKYVTELDYNILLQKWAAKFGEFDSYREVFAAGAEISDDAMEASISECLMDIYQNLKDFISAYSLGNEEVMNDALAECRFQFKEYWGQQLVNVLRAIHYLVATDADVDADDTAIKNTSQKEESDWVDGFFNQFRDDNI